ncbi:MAG: ABC transporter ATP-binding protein [Oscillospiraceae bacterium]|nr:ABC transporter ATP-binding protein [Oscillospiraceae bacterium]
MAEEKRQKFKAAEAGRGPGSGGPGARGGFQKPKDTKKTVRRILGYLAGRKGTLLLVGLCLIVGTVANVAGGYMLRPILNSLTAEGAVSDKLSGLARRSALLLGLYLAGSLAAYLQSSLMARVAQGAANCLRSDLFAALERLPLSYFDRHPHGELMSRFTNDADNVSLAMEQSFVNLVSSALLFLGLVAMMLYTAPLLFLITALTLFASLMVFKVLGGRSRGYYRRQQAALGQVNGEIQEIIEGLRVVKAFTYEERAKAEFDELNRAYRDAATDANFFSGAIFPVSANLTSIGFALTAIAGGFLALVRGFDVGGFAVYLNYSRQIGQPVNQVSQQLTAILSALAGAERIFELMDAEPEIDAGKVTLEAVESAGTRAWVWKKPDGSTVPLRGDVRLEHVDFSYVPGKPVLRDVNVYAKPGQKIAFVGSTGAGKTTITNLINRFYEIENGRITYDGIDVREISKDSLRRSLGAVLQDTHLFTGTVMDNIRYGRLDATDEDCVAAAKQANAHSFIRRLPDGYNTMVTGDGANLSQGQRQLLAIARAAVADPPVMVMDEATSSIDTRTEKHIQAGMDQLMEGRTVFVIAHRLSTVRDADCIVVIEQGQVREKGSHEELLAERGRYYLLYTGQHILD